MLFFDQLRKNDAQLHWLGLMLGTGLALLLGGLWWVQIVGANRYQEMVEVQHYRTVRMPAARGQVLDRHQRILAENQPDYRINLYLEELSPAFREEYRRIRPRVVVTNELPIWKSWLGLPNVTTQFVRVQGAQLERQARFQVVHSVAERVSDILQTPVPLNASNFNYHYMHRRAMPFNLVSGLSPQLVARFEEKSSEGLEASVEMRGLRVYPYSNLTAQVVGFVRPDDRSAPGEDAYFSYRLPDYRGQIGIEGGLDQILRGRAGVKSVLVNSLLYRQNDTIWEPTLPGTNVVLTLDIELQRAATAALHQHIGVTGRGAVVVMEVHSGNILAMVSSPSYDPNRFTRRISHRDYQRILESTALRNRVTAEQYQAGSVFKLIVALAALETPAARFDPLEEYEVKANPATGRGIIWVGNHPFRDTVSPGLYNLERAIVKSSNAYFIALGLRPGVFERVIELGHRLHLGERFPADCLPLRQEAAGHFPSLEQIRKSSWQDGDTANICIGQGQMDVTPLQVAVMISAVANGGTVVMPRLVDRYIAPDSLAPTQITARGRIREQLGVSARHLKILHEAMLAETESPEGTGRYVQGCGYRVCGKTGTAELPVMREDGSGRKNTTWFGSFAPYAAPRFAVVIMVENGVSGGATCAPIAHDVYVALKAWETRNADDAPSVTAMVR
ncbi:MAG TPA: penicillin-binding transpeptidase domain-containing protein [Verrucomicrobiota bacterium]|nr:penicillin-binding transpeptidase domain-containing protein [Verrucomicrobiota bacterium]HNT14980.1 penicillin-binding transpeptidase domain-containing protein [Verrucomicrobiota bacterium]